MIIELLVKRELSGKLWSLSYVLIRMNWHNSVRLGSSLKNKNHVRKDNIPWWLWFIYLPFYDSVQHRIFEVSLVHKGLITVARSVLWMSFTRVEHHCISTSSIHVLKLVRRDKTWEKQTNKQQVIRFSWIRSTLAHTRLNTMRQSKDVYWYVLNFSRPIMVHVAR